MSEVGGLSGLLYLECEVCVKWVVYQDYFIWSVSEVGGLSGLLYLECEVGVKWVVYQDYFIRSVKCA